MVHYTIKEKRKRARRRNQITLMISIVVSLVLFVADACCIFIIHAWESGEKPIERIDKVAFCDNNSRIVAGVSASLLNQMNISSEEEFERVDLPKPKKKKKPNSDETRHVEKFVPFGYGKCHPYMAWQKVTDRTTAQYRLRCEVENYDKDGLGKVGKRYAVAVKPYYGNIGDYLKITQTDGLTYECIIVDYKSDENTHMGWVSEYVHSQGDIVEFVVDRYSFYGSPKTIYDVHPEWKRNISEILNVGNYWDSNQ